MARRADRARHFVALLLIGSVLSGSAGLAGADTPESKVSANDSGVRIEIDRKGHDGGAGADATAAAGRTRRPVTRRPAPSSTSRPTCRLVRVPSSRSLPPRLRNGDPARPLTPFAVVCNGRVVGLIWLERSSGRRQAAATLSEQLVHDVPLPVGEVRVSPAGRGLAGLETWFWVAGFDGNTVAATVDALGTRVEVEATPVGYHWDFGDGVSSPGDLGRPAPERSSVTHVYETTSKAEGFLVQLVITFAIRYRIDGGPWTTLPPITRRTTHAYPVTEVRGQLTRQ